MPVVFYTTFSPSPPPPFRPRSGQERRGGLFVSVALVRQVSSSRWVPRPGCYPTPCSKECGLSSIPTTQNRDRPTDLRLYYDTCKWGGRQQHGFQIKIENEFLNPHQSRFYPLKSILEISPKDITRRLKSCKLEALKLAYKIIQKLYLLMRQAVK